MGRDSIALRFTAYAADGGVVDRWDQALTVPPLGDAGLALSTPRFLHALSPLEARAIRAGRIHPPTASRRFRATDRVFIEVDCYVDGAEPARISAQLLNASGEPVVDLMIRRRAAGPVRFRLPLSSLAPSTYVLQIKGRAGEHQAQYHAAFHVS